METALITGANGFIGSHLACELVRRGYMVYGVHRSHNSKNEEYMKYVQEGKIVIFYGSVSDIDTNTIPNVDYVYHIAGKVSAWGKLDEFRGINLGGTRNFLEYAKRCNVKCFTYLSSVAVYGFYGYKQLEEDGEKRPFNNPYSLSKLETENYVSKYARENNLPYVIIRPGNVYGEYDFTSSHEVYDLIKKEKMIICGSGKYESCWVYVKNLVEAIILTSQNMDARNTDYNVADGNTNLIDYLTKVALAFNVRPRFTKVPVPLAKLTAILIEGFYKLFRIKDAPLITKFTVYQNLADYSFSTRKLEATGYKRLYSEDEGIKRTVEYFKQL